MGDCTRVPEPNDGAGWNVGADWNVWAGTTRDGAEKVGAKEPAPDPNDGATPREPDWALATDASIKNAAAMVRVYLKFMVDLLKRVKLIKKTKEGRVTVFVICCNNGKRFT